MRAIILAAGIGYRLLPLTKEIPKCMVRVAGKTILQSAIDSLVANGIDDIVIVVGYKKEMIKAFLFETYEDRIEFTFVENDIYDTTNNIYSLWLAVDYFDDDIILLESDIVFEQKIIADLLEHTHQNVIVVDTYDGDTNGTMVRVDDQGNVFHLMTKEHQQYPHDRADLYKTVNIYKLSQNFIKQHFYPGLKNYIEAKSYSKYYELILGMIIYLNSPKLKAMPVNHLKWYEIDTYPDLDKAEFVFSSPKQQIEMIENRFGGLWNYPGVIDFLYMRNTYFPPKDLLSGMKRHIQNLVSGYSSCQTILNKKTSMLENLNEPYTFLFNGSSQGIKFLSPLLGRVSLPVPTFQEYVNTLKPGNLNTHPLPMDTFHLYVKQFAEQALAASSDTLVLVNPNNPTSCLIEKDDLMYLLNTYAHQFQFIVVDESFIDFASPDYSLKDQVDRFDNLVIIKSMGKTYGVAGLRLGYIYTRNSKIKHAYENDIPIWNINSFAEFFIEEALKYKDEYAESLTMIKKDRDDFVEHLNNIPGIKLILPHGNFILVELQKEFPVNAASLKEYLFASHCILVKDVTAKISQVYPDADSNGFLRLAVLKKEENNLLCKGLEEMG